MTISIPLAKSTLQGELALPEGTNSIILFAHGSGSSRLSPRNRFLANTFNDAGFGTLLFDLLTPEEEAVDRYTREFRFDIALLAERLVAATRWVQDNPTTRTLEIGLFGASTGAAAALIAAAQLPETIHALVSRGGRPDLAGEMLEKVTCPTQLIVGALDTDVLDLNERALARLSSVDKKLETVAHATHLFEEPGTLSRAADLARDWFVAHLAADEYSQRLHPHLHHRGEAPEQRPH